MFYEAKINKIILKLYPKQIELNCPFAKRFLGNLRMRVSEKVFHEIKDNTQTSDKQSIVGLDGLLIR